MKHSFTTAYEAVRQRLQETIRNLDSVRKSAVEKFNESEAVNGNVHMIVACDEERRLRESILDVVKMQPGKLEVFEKIRIRSEIRMLVERMTDDLVMEIAGDNGQISFETMKDGWRRTVKARVIETLKAIWLELDQTYAEGETELQTAKQA